MGGAGVAPPPSRPHAAVAAWRRMDRRRSRRRRGFANARRRYGCSRSLRRDGARRAARGFRPDQCRGYGPRRESRRRPAPGAAIPADVVAGGADAAAVGLCREQAARRERSGGRAEEPALDRAATARRLRPGRSRAPAALPLGRARHRAAACQRRRALLAPLRRRPRERGRALARGRRGAWAHLRAR